MTLYRCFAWNRRARATDADGALWFPREFQGDGRHDNPDVYGCLYLADRPTAAVVEQLARFRGQRLVEGMLVRRRLPLALAEIEVDESAAKILDLDDPAELLARELRPSEVATRTRSVTQPQALALYREGVAALRWWSTYESLWANVTVFDRAARWVRVADVTRLGLDHPAVIEGADLLGVAA